MSYRKAIHDLLVQTAIRGTFKAVDYTVARPSLLIEGTAVASNHIYAEANEIRGAFAVDANYGRSYRQDRTGWAWLLRVRFNEEVLLEEFEDSLLQSPLMIAPNPAEGIARSVRLLLEDCIYEHPPRGEASNGTEVTYRFVAELCPQ